MTRSVYSSTTLGDIPLSFTGKHLLQTLRECVADALAAGDTSVNANALSRARGKLAQYMSRMEEKNQKVFMCEMSDDELKDECAKRGIDHLDTFLHGSTDGMNNREMLLGELSDEELVKELDKRSKNAKEWGVSLQPTSKLYIVTFLPKNFALRLFDSNTAKIRALGVGEAIRMGKRVCRELCKDPANYFFKAEEAKEE